jgi:SCF-associated factor 1
LAEKTIIQVALGDHHHAALTSQGEVYTWGEGSNGQLGLGDGRHTVPEPRKVIFAGDDPENQSFVFGITAGGWHTGALVLGSRASDKSREEVRVKDEKSKEKDREDENEERGGTRGIQDEVQAGTDGDGMGRIALGSPHFRIGFAGRGAMSGMGRAAPTPGLRGLRWNRGGQGNNGAGPSEN